MRSAEDVFEFFAADVVMRDFPTGLPQKGRWVQRRFTGCLRTRTSDHASTEAQGAGTSSNPVTRLAVELEWTGFLSLLVIGLAAGSEMKAFVAMFLRHEISPLHEYLELPHRSGLANRNERINW
jgi:hypothetical protein